MAPWASAALRASMPIGRRTLDDNDSDCCGIPRGWVADDGHDGHSYRVWWDLRYLHCLFRRSGWTSLKLGKRFRLFNAKTESCGLGPHGPPSGVAEASSQTLGVIAFLWIMVDDGKKDERMQTTCSTFVRKMAQSAGGASQPRAYPGDDPRRPV